MSERMWREADGATEDQSLLFADLVYAGGITQVEIDYEAARNAYIDGRVAVAAKLITGTPMEPHDEAAFVLTMVFNAALGLEGDADE